MRVLVIDQHGESREYDEAQVAFPTYGGNALFVIRDVAGLHIYPIATTTAHFIPENDMDYIVFDALTRGRT